MLSNSIELLTILSQMNWPSFYTYFDPNFLLAIRHNRDYSKLSKTSCSWLFNFQSISRLWDFCSALTPPLTEQQSTDKKLGLMMGWEGRGRCTVQIPLLHAIKVAQNSWFVEVATAVHGSHRRRLHSEARYHRAMYSNPWRPVLIPYQSNTSKVPCQFIL